MLATHKARETFVAELVAGAGADVWYCTRLMRYASAYAWLLKEAQRDEKQENKFHRMAKKIEKLAAELNCTVEYAAQTPTVTLVTTTGKRIGVPTS